MQSKQRRVRFAICLAAKPDADLRAAKIYRVLPDAAEEAGCLRVVDESGEDYLYAATRFVILEIPEKARGRLLKAVASSAGQ